ncbi:S8 family serine peptidase [Archangium lansingense]|uniref:S8 family serine peptidase n=1 Tax=Archangium lansingense TaxID=2995310 RepID=A0ABT4ABU2_9BACT|nr:S8 family serine peptidase [Archangium lansinium]MCY1079148.1 S8 family serine peptidase [Archangium lansinium]
MSRTTLSSAALRALSPFEPVVHFREAGVQVIQSREARGGLLRDVARTVLREEPEIAFAGTVLSDPVSGSPVLYTENFFVKFDDGLPASEVMALLGKYGLTLKRELEYARNAYFLSAPEGTGQKVFQIAHELLNEKPVDFCHPELIHKVSHRGVFPQQWHLRKTDIDGRTVDAHANIEAAWALSQGEGVTIAIIDDGVDIDHEEFSGSGKIVAPRDVTRGTDDPRPIGEDNHGTACAGIACAEGRFGACGVAPRARLMPIRLASGLGSQNEADAFIWAADHGADVITCCWGPVEGRWWNPDDPAHQQNIPMPDSTRLAIDYAIRHGRNGKGCVIFWAAGNGREDVDLDGYASYPKVIAVAACNDSGRRSVYSDFGRAIWCSFPSNDFASSPPGPLNPWPNTPGIWTTDRSGAQGYNPGRSTRGDAAGNYTNSFGGTSSASPGAAGVAALVLASNPELRWEQVKDILKQCCDRIDPEGGEYDAQGHSLYYGHGRLNAAAAVQLAHPPQPGRVVVQTAIQDIPIRDLQTARLSVAVADSDPIVAVRIAVDLQHTYIGDLLVTLEPPASTGVSPVVLHSRSGGSMGHLRKTYDAINTPGLSSLEGKNPQGTWTLVVQDQDRLDTGMLRSFSVEWVF